MYIHWLIMVTGQNGLCDWNLVILASLLVLNQWTSEVHHQCCTAMVLWILSETNILVECVTGGKYNREIFENDRDNTAGNSNGQCLELVSEASPSFMWVSGSVIVLNNVHSSFVIYSSCVTIHNSRHYPTIDLPFPPC